jgi:hypothetical protein
MKDWNVPLMIVLSTLLLSWFMQRLTNHIMDGLRELARKVDNLKTQIEKLED